ncbi:MAG: tRNA preQ1(34) S-adenosylmethionine ribosyltransferase-isomerase QueA [Anaerolineales bacterium]|nr:tRNA preQ1(34) S-adenosylmethionine ribosyltransferase-isomerase QueA [Anaerolineales bacterium]
MRTSDFDYDLPPDRIAQTPAEPRDSSRLLVLDRQRETVSHHVFQDLPALLDPGDVLVINQTRVLPARLRARKVPSGGKVELLLLKRIAPRTWEVWVGGKGLLPGRRLAVEGGPEAEVVEDLGGPRRLVCFSAPISPDLDRIGEMPLPPYIHTPLRRPDQYQTVYALDPGSAAAPTAGLHFTPALLARIEARGIGLARVTLHVGLDTFAPVIEEDPQAHAIHTEWCQVTPQAAAAINAARNVGRRIVAVGTTSVRTLETAARAAAPGQAVGAVEGATGLFILPGFEFRAVDAMVTNFHLPRSTLLMLVSAFAGRERVLRAYEIAKAEGYRFYSFGDAMLML